MTAFAKRGHVAGRTRVDAHEARSRDGRRRSHILFEVIC